MTPKELADQTGLSLEEAEMVVRARESKVGTIVRVPIDSSWSSPRGQRFLAAMDALNRAQKKVGVAPVALAGDELVKGDLPTSAPMYEKNVEEPEGRIIDQSEDFRQ